MCCCYSNTIIIIQQRIENIVSYNAEYCNNKKIQGRRRVMTYNTPKEERKKEKRFRFILVFVSIIIVCRRRRIFIELNKKKTKI